MRTRVIASIASLVLALGLVVGIGAAGSSAPSDKRFRVKAMILTTFDAEEEPLLRLFKPDKEFAAGPGQVAPLHCWSRLGICSTVTGTTKSNSGPSTAALMLDDRFSFSSKTLFIIAGIAGISSDVGTLGDVGIANWAVDTDLGSYFVDRADTPDNKGWLRFSEYDEAAIKLNVRLASRALGIARRVKLEDRPEAVTERSHYGAAEAAEKPSVRPCDTMGSDGFWVGKKKAAQLHYVFETRVRSVDPSFRYRCALSQFEDPGIISGLERFGFADQLVVLRSASDFEDQRPGERDIDQYRRVAIPPEGRGEFAGFDAARENHSLIAFALAHWLRP